MAQATRVARVAPAWPRLAVRVEHLYLLLPLIGLGVYAALVPMPPNDFWWYLRSGQIVAESGVPRTNIFAWTLPADTPYTYAWLASWLFYVIHQTGGLELVIAARNLLLLAALAVIGVEARQRSGSWALAGLATTLAGALSLNNMIVRPQMWSWLPFVLTLYLLRRYADGRLRPGWLAALPIMMLFWANAHGAFVLGLLATFAVAAGETIRARLGQAGARSARQLGWLYAASLGSALATLVTPYGVDLYRYLAVMTNHPVQKYVADWLHPTPADPVNRLFYGSILLLVAVLALARRRPTVTDVLLIVGFLWLAWSMQRTVTWFGFALAPVLVAWLAGERGAQAPAPPARPLALVNGALALVFVVPLVLAQPWFVDRLPLPEYYRARLLRDPAAGPLLSSDTPVAAADYLSRHPGGRLYNEAGFGSYLIWATPGIAVAIYPHFEIFPPEFIEDYVKITRGEDAAERLARYGADRVILSLAEQPQLAAALATSPGWTREYADRISEVWRYTPPPGDMAGG
jgi:hypothetical protein